MNFKMGTLTLALLAGTSFAADAKQINKSEENVQEFKSWEATLSVNPAIDYDGKLFKTKGQYLQGSIGPSYQLSFMNERFKHSTQIKHTNFKTEEINNNDKYGVTMYDTGLAQKLSYDFYVNDMLLRPFVEIGAYVGYFKMTGKYRYYYSDGSDKVGTSWLAMNYNRVNLNLGLQVEVVKNIEPYIRYESSTIEFESNKRVKIDKKYKEMTSNSISIGTSIRF